MCELCYCSPCRDRCPNADDQDPPVFAKCEICGEPIYDGDEYYEIDEKPYCEACVYGCYRTAEVENDWLAER